MKTENTVNGFAKVIRSYEKQAINPDSEKAYADSLYNLATAVAYSVLKKCIDVSMNETLVRTRRTIARDLNNLDNLKYAIENAYETKYDSNGDTHTETIDKDLHEAVKTLSAQTLGDGIDLIHDAIITIITETNKANERKTLSVGFMESAYTVRELKRKVYINTADSVNGWTDRETTPIQETFKAVRRSIESNRPVKVNTSGYMYLDDIAHDTESDASDVIYRRFGKYAGLGGQVTDFNGKDVAYIPDETIINDTDEIIERLALTDRQSQVLKLRLSGYGYKAIATYFGVTQRAIAKTVEAIQKKAVSIGLTPTE